jgi:hypothetical protein
MKSKLLDWLCRLLVHKVCVTCKIVTPKGFLDSCGTKCIMCRHLEIARKYGANNVR